MARISELARAPQWLLNATVKNENVEMDGSCVIWHDGVWRDGVWRGGIWHGGDWCDKNIRDRVLFHASFIGIFFDADGEAKAYRAVRDNLTGKWNSRFEQPIGEWYDPDACPAGCGTCCPGIHVTSAANAFTYFKHHPTDVLIEARFKREDLLDCDGEKARIRGGFFRKVDWPWK